MNTDQNITIQQGDDETVVIPVETSDSTSGDWLTDLSNLTIRYKLTTEPAGGTTELEQTSADAAVSIVKASSIDSQTLTDTGIPDSADVIEVVLSGSDTSSLSGGYYHECELEDSGGTVQTILQGEVYIENTVT